MCASVYVYNCISRCVYVCIMTCTVIWDYESLYSSHTSQAIFIIQPGPAETVPAWPRLQPCNPVHTLV